MFHYRLNDKRKLQAIIDLWINRDSPDED